VIIDPVPALQIFEGRAAAEISLIQSARLIGHTPYERQKDMLTRLPTQKASAINELLPHNWTPETAVNV